MKAFILPTLLLAAATAPVYAQETEQPQDAQPAAEQADAAAESTEAAPASNEAAPEAAPSDTTDAE